ncbi:MAG: EAL domain-containing protein [Pseudomonadota bacterium]|nr:MAG: EAL domain-containing protein [Pseudomonadota bacterium]
MKLDSLRQRYLVLAVALALVITVCISAAQYLVGYSGRTAAGNLAGRVEVVQQIQHIKGLLWNAEDALDLYMLSPSAAQRTTFHHNIEQARRRIHILADDEWVQSNGLADAAGAVDPVLAQLQQKAIELTEIRLDADMMYPAMSLARGSMLDANRGFQTAVDLSLLACRDQHGCRVDAIYELLVETRSHWNRLISAYRLYLINRLGTLFEDALLTQADDVGVLYGHVDQAVATLADYTRRGEVMIEIEVGVEDMAAYAPQWYAGYSEVLQINSTDEWRGDLPLIRDVMQPLMLAVRARLENLDARLADTAADDIAAQARAVRFTTLLLWATAFAVLLFVVMGYLVFSRKLLRPVAQVARQLRDEASGQTGEMVPSAESREVRHLVDAFLEMRKQVHSRQMALEHMAMHDALTSLPNRALLVDRLGQAITAARRDSGSVALILLDLDRFKEVNDTLGHQAGDLLLKQVAVRLHRALRGSDTVARLGGDEFAILLPGITQAGVGSVAAKIVEVVEPVYKVDDHTLFIGASIGVALYPQHGDTPDVLVQRADVAMYLSKRSNTSVTIYDMDKDMHSVAQLSLLSDLREAVDDNQLRLHYQPKVSLASGEVIGVEALLRWEHPELGQVPPGQFIPVAEQSGLIRRITKWVLDAAILQCSEWLAQGIELPVSVNLSVWDFQDAELDRTIGEVLEKRGVPGRLLELEITESAMMAEPERTRELLLRLDRMGIGLSIDDYGAGFSSLAYLKQLPVDVLKIDKSFVRDMAHNENDQLIVRSTIDLAHNLGLHVIAEGAEHQDTCELLKDLGCDSAQGYYLGMPQSVADLQQWLDSRTLTAVRA